MNIIKYAVIALAIVAGDAAFYIGAKIQTNNQWKQELVKREFAEYNTKTGDWEFRTMSDVVTSGLILNK